MPPPERGTADAKMSQADSGSEKSVWRARHSHVGNAHSAFLLLADTKSDPKFHRLCHVTHLPCIAHRPAHRDGFPAHLLASSHPSFTPLSEGALWIQTLKVTTAMFRIISQLYYGQLLTLPSRPSVHPNLSIYVLCNPAQLASSLFSARTACLPPPRRCLPLQNHTLLSARSPRLVWPRAALCTCLSPADPVTTPAPSCS